MECKYPNDICQNMIMIGRGFMRIIICFCITFVVVLLLKGMCKVAKEKDEEMRNMFREGDD